MSTHLGWNQFLPEMFSVLINYWYVNTTNLRLNIFHRFKKPYLLHHKGLQIADRLLQWFLEEIQTILINQKDNTHDKIKEITRYKFISFKSYGLFFLQTAEENFCCYCLEYFAENSAKVKESGLYLHTVTWWTIFLLYMNLCLLPCTYHLFTDGKKKKRLKILDLFFFFFFWTKARVDFKTFQFSICWLLTFN